MNMRTDREIVVLNSSYEFLNTVSWKQAIRLICKGKVEVVKTGKRVIKNFEKTVEIVIPKVLRLLKYVRAVFKKAVPFSKKNIHIRDNYTCQYCGKRDKVGNTRLGIDHIVPRASGGKSTWENCVSACWECNNKKGRKPLRETGMFLKRKPVRPTIAEFLNIRLRNSGFDLAAILNDLDYATT